MIVTVVSDRNRQVRRHCLLLTGKENAILHDSMPDFDTHFLAISGFAREHCRSMPKARTKIIKLWSKQQCQEKNECSMQGIAH